MAQRESDTEKITINLVPVDLGRIDLLVSQGLYASRTDLIRTAIRRLLDDNGDALRDAVSRDDLNIGIAIYTREELESQRQRLRIKVLGMLHFTADVTPELADAVVEHITIRGVLRGPPAVLERLKPKTDRGVRG